MKVQQHHQRTHTRGKTERGRKDKSVKHKRKKKYKSVRISPTIGPVARLGFCAVWDPDPVGGVGGNS